MNAREDDTACCRFESEYAESLVGKNEEVLVERNDPKQNRSGRKQVRSHRDAGEEVLCGRDPVRITGAMGKHSYCRRTFAP